jgi:hypothetical protein
VSALRRFEIEYGPALAEKARNDLDRLVAYREQQAAKLAKREAAAIVTVLISKLADALIDVDALCEELGVERLKRG